MTDQPADPPVPVPVPDVCPDCATPTTGLTPGDPQAVREPCGHPVVFDPVVFTGTVPPADVPPPAGAA